MDNNLIIRKLLRMGYPVTSYQDYLSDIENFKSWYSGKVRKFHNYTYYNGIEHVSAVRKSMQMPKKVCEDWANNTLNEKFEWHIENSAIEKSVEQILKENKFYSRANKLTELMFALGTAAFVERVETDGDNKKIFIDYVRADMIYPLNWNDDEIISCAFCSNAIIEGKEHVYFAIHEQDEKGNYHIKNYLYRYTASYLKEVPLPDNVPEDWNTGSCVPLFQIIKPNIINNLDLDSPYGISVFANAIDQIKGLDLVYDSYVNEFVLGKKRVIIPMSMAKRKKDSDMPVFDSNDMAFYALDAQDANDKKDMFKEISPDIRAEQHSKALQDNLNLVSSNVGFGGDHYKFENGGLKTATEVISEKSDMYQNIVKHELVLQEAIIGVIKAIVFLQNGSATDDLEITIKFDDSIIIDTNTEIDNNIKLVNAQLKPKVKAIKDIHGVTDDEAQSMLDDINIENKVTGDDDQDFFGYKKKKDDIKSIGSE